MKMRKVKMSKKYDDMSFAELQEAYRAAVDVRKKFNIKVRELTESIEVAGKKYKKLQAELAELENAPVPDDVYREEGILALIGGRILDQPEADPDTEDPDTEDPDTEDPDTEAGPERKPRRKRRVNKDD